MEETKTYVFGNEGAQVPAWLALNNGNNGWFGGNSFGGGVLGFILGLLFGNGWGGFGGFGGNGFGGAAASLGAQATANNNTDLIMNAINGTDSDVRSLASTLNADVNEVRTALSTISAGLASVGSQVGMSGLQIVNAIQAGDASLASKLCECCCENRLLTTQQGYESRIATIEQTNQLGSQADRNTRSITDAIAAQTVAMNDGFCAIKERELQSKIDSLSAANTALRGQIDNANQTAAITGYINSVVTPLAKEVADIRANQPATTTVTYPNLTAVPTSSLYGAMVGYGYGYPYGAGSIWA